MSIGEAVGPEALTPRGFWWRSTRPISPDGTTYADYILAKVESVFPTLAADMVTAGRAEPAPPST